MIKHFLKKNKEKLIATFLILVIFGAGFYCAWQIQAQKMREYENVFKKVIILMEIWERRIEKLEKEKKERVREKKKQRDWNNLLED